MKSWPVYFKDNLIVGNPLMDTAVITLWTPKEVVAKGLDMSSVSLVGQLYTRRGINFVIRNILANPRIRKLHILGNDLSGSGESLLNYQFDLDKNIDKQAFTAFKQNVSLIDNRKIPAKNKIHGKKGALWRDPQIFKEETARLGDTFPSEFANLTIRSASIPSAWVEILKTLLKFGVASKPVKHYDNQGKSFLKELLNLVVVIRETDNYSIEVPSFLPFTEADVRVYLENFFKKDCQEDDYTYGERLFNYDGFDQVSRMVAKLKAFPQDKGGLCVLWKPKKDSFPYYKSAKIKRVPCLTLIQGQVYHHRLFLTAYFRSNDMGSAWALNAYALRALQARLADQLGVKLGKLITISNMAHLYPRDFSLARRVVKERGKGQNCVFDPRGNLVITTDKHLIKVTHISPDGARTLEEWVEDGRVVNASKRLGDKILGDLAISQVAHAFDIGCQLARAEEAVRRGLSFTQDRPLPR